MFTDFTKCLDLEIIVVYVDKLHEVALVFYSTKKCVLLRSHNR